MHVSKISIARLFNLGNFEHKRVEVTVDFDHSANPFTPSETITELSDILETIGKSTELIEQVLKSEQESLVHYEEALKKEPESQYAQHWAQVHRDGVAARIRELESVKFARAQALKRLDALSGFVSQG